MSSSESYESDSPSSGLSNPESCFRCGRYGHWTANCYAKTDVDGRHMKKQHVASSAGVYAIGDSSGKIYVGKSMDTQKRFNEHTRGSGTSFLKGNIKKRSTATNGSKADMESWERNETLEQMYRTGIRNVRGWMFTASVLTDQQTQDAFNQICEKYDLCRKCGRNSHFMAKCYAKTRAEWACK